MKNVAQKKLLWSVLFMFLLALGAVLGSKETGVASSRLAVHFIDIGQGDSILVSLKHYYSDMKFIFEH